MIIELQVHLARDEETGWWYVSASDIPGLVLEAATAAALVQKIEVAAPEMIDLNMDEIISANSDAVSVPRPELAYRPVFDSPLLASA